MSRVVVRDDVFQAGREVAFSISSVLWGEDSDLWFRFSRDLTAPLREVYRLDVFSARAGAVEAVPDPDLSLGRIYLARVALGVGYSGEFVSPDGLSIVYDVLSIPGSHDEWPGEVFSYAEPVAEFVTVTGRLVDAAGVARAGVVVSFPLVLEDEPNISERDALSPMLIAETGRVVDSISIETTTASDGSFSVRLRPNSDFTPAGSRYFVRFSDEVSDVALVTVPDAGSVDLIGLLPVE
jgi:hypothetical protein